MPRTRPARRPWLGAGIVLAAVTLGVGPVRVSSAGTSGAVRTGTPTHQETGFGDGTPAPFRMCTTQQPNYGRVEPVNGNQAMSFVWMAAGYNGTRMTRGAEACGDLQIRKEGWYGLRFLVPRTGFPSDKNTIIAQIFNTGGCNSWAGTLSVQNEELWFEHRGACAGATRVLLDKRIPRDRWLPITMHFVASRANAGRIDIWYRQLKPGQPAYRKTGINFSSFGAYSGDQLADLPNNAIGLKFGMYCHDPANYTPDETRKLYFDNVSQLDGNPADAFDIVNPTA